MSTATAVEKRGTDHTAMRESYFDGQVKYYDENRRPDEEKAYRAGFLAALKFARDSVPRAKGGEL